MSRLDAFDQAVSYLALRPRTKKELGAYLKKKEYTMDEIVVAMDKLIEYRYVDDQEYAKTYIRVAMEKAHGRNKIDRKLMEKGVERAIIEAAWFELEEEPGGRIDEKKRALELAVKMTKQHLGEGKELDEKFFAKVGRRLASQGYGADSVYFVLGKLRGIRKQYE